VHKHKGCERESPNRPGAFYRLARYATPRQTQIGLTRQSRYPYTSPKHHEERKHIGNAVQNRGWWAADVAAAVLGFCQPRHPDKNATNLSARRHRDRRWQISSHDHFLLEHSADSPLEEDVWPGALCPEERRHGVACCWAGGRVGVGTELGKGHLCLANIRIQAPLRGWAREAWLIEGSDRKSTRGALFSASSCPARATLREKDQVVKGRVVQRLPDRWAGGRARRRQRNDWGQTMRLWHPSNKNRWSLSHTM